MSIVKRNNYLPSSSFIDDFLSKDLFDWADWRSEGGSLPKVNVAERDDSFAVEMAAPGMKKEDFHIELDNEMLTIHAESSNQQEGNSNDRYSRREFSYQSFKRSFYLPNTVEADKINAKYKDGILSLTIPKKEEARKKPVKTISVS